MQSTGNVSLMCGGYTGFTATAKTYAAASAQDGSALTAADGTTAVSAIDCWWLIPSPRPQWSRFLYKNPTVAGVPTPREGFTMDYDFVERSVLIFGGLDSSNQNLNDCWYISLGPDDKVAHLESYDWKSCRPTTNATGEIATQPPPALRSRLRVLCWNGRQVAVHLWGICRRRYWNLRSGRYVAARRA